MAEIRLRILAEMENLESVLGLLPDEESLPRLSDLELAGVAALLHSFYNGVENILKQACTERGVKLPEGATWHRDLLNASVENGLMPEELWREFGPYLAFRHFFSHGYAMDLEWERMEPLVSNAASVYQAFKRHLNTIFSLGV